LPLASSIGTSKNGVGADISLRALLSRFANSTPASRPSAVPRRGHKLVSSAKAGRAAAVTLPSIACFPSRASMSTIARLDWRTA
jgi:hypothetical protein